MQATICKLHVYPVKSLQGIEVKEVTCWETGFELDREWVIVDDKNLFVTQRQLPKMASIRTALTENSLVLSHPDHESLHVPLTREHLNEDEQVTFTIWKDEAQGVDEGKAARTWLNDVFGEYRGGGLRLLRFSKSYRRDVREKYSTHPQAQLKFADACPYLIVSHDSLEALNSVLSNSGQHEVPIDRFRGNIEISGAAAWQEFQAEELQINDVILKSIGPCMRCPMIGMNQQTGEVIDPGQPFKTLMALAIPEGKDGAFFGIHASFLTGEGKRIKVGDTLHIQPKR
ncbi:MOSC domain-containing protein [Alteromonas sp. a30]|uniref:MOSC domain-containing protein n=1 Tax=Alteromonas sp. a30 TaxID=2730917 RepID=UPI002280BDBE|nr:MOSC N-terminal beta barrel domain-containing protein [Alteromonas sp. a30]MCY7295993.1 MOSC domain-containing protein [Alteromonas sp. a30]